jgi:hypothetical protein
MVIMDVAGFRPSTLQYVLECIKVLRKYYPGRLGLACLINVPPIFHAMWNLISPFLDEEILSKTRFLPKECTSVDDALRWADDHSRALIDPTA